MYKINLPAACEIVLTGDRIDLDEYPLTIHSGVNWILFPLSESISLTNAFAGFAINGDIVKSKDAFSTYNGSIWRGTLKTLTPGNGYIYKSATTDERTFNWSNKQKH